MKSKTPTQLLSILLIFILLLSAQSISTTAQESIDKNQILYVGGSGPNNYTSIQTAINEAQAQDTIYVYNGVYQEFISIEKEITLIGESTEETIIQPQQEFPINETFIVASDNVKINRFTLDPMYALIQGKSNATITNICFENIYFSSGYAILEALACENLLFYNCTTSETIDFSAFMLLDCSDVSIISNILFSQNPTSSIILGNTTNVEIVGNKLSKSKDNSSGICVASSSNIKLIGNTITASEGLKSYNNKNIEVKNNNFIDCETQINHSSPLCKAKFDANYYGQPRILPKIIWTPPFGLRIDWHPRNQQYNLPLVTMKTNHGSMILELYDDKMPITSQNFMALTKIEFFDGLVFHRVMEDFVIQGGGFDVDGTRYESPFGEIPLEIHPDVLHVDGALSMARTTDPDSATSQFFICDGRQKSLDDEWRMENLGEHGYAAFGALVSGFDVLGDIASVETERKHMRDDWPVEEVIITYARLAE